MRTDVLKRWLREPLLHFLALGAAVFAVTSAKDDAPSPEPTPAPVEVDREIVVTAEMVEGLRRDWASRAGLPPDPEEEGQLVHQLVVEEALYREARALGLDRGDPIVRRRLVQKMRFLLEEMEDPGSPTDAQLAEVLAAHPTRYRQPARVSFEHVFVSRNRHGVEAEALAAAHLSALVADPEAVDGLGDPYLHGRSWTLASEETLSGLFGRGFVDALLEVEPGAWAGPLSSTYGLHLVRISAREDRRPLTLDEARQDLSEEWVRERRAAATQEMVDRIADRYSVRVEAPPVEEAAATSPLSQQVAP